MYFGLVVVNISGLSRVNYFSIVEGGTRKRIYLIFVVVSGSSFMIILGDVYGLVCTILIVFR